jgi:hypothetical protein
LRGGGARGDPRWGWRTREREEWKRGGAAEGDARERETNGETKRTLCDIVCKNVNVVPE